MPGPAPPSRLSGDNDPPPGRGFGSGVRRTVNPGLIRMGLPMPARAVVQSEPVRMEEPGSHITRFVECFLRRPPGVRGPGRPPAFQAQAFPLQSGGLQAVGDIERRAITGRVTGLRRRRR